MEVRLAGKHSYFGHQFCNLDAKPALILLGLLGKVKSIILPQIDWRSKHKLNRVFKVKVNQ